MRFYDLRLPASDSTPLFVRQYRATIETAEPARTLIIVHGACEYGQRYDRVARTLAELGWNVLIGDLRGHGRSGGVPTHVERFDQYLDDLDVIRKHFRPAPERTALLGHSTGGLISIRYLQTRPHIASALVLMCPLLALKVAVNPMTTAWGRMLSAFTPRVRFRSRVDPADLIRDAALLQERLNDALIHRSVTAGWYFQVKGALKPAWDEAAKIDLPLLVMQAGQDRIVDPLAVQPWLDAAGSEDKTCRMMPHHYHELLQEADWRETTIHIAEWLNQRIPHQPVRTRAAGV
jgi:lysophospholipase